MPDSAETPPGIDIRPLETVDAVFAASAVLTQVWGGDRSGMPPNLLRALAHSGNYAVGLYEGDRMVGASVAFFAAPAARSMHSHITGVLPGRQSQGLGRVLKQHQREWALARDVGHITWTFDPLVARNAHFNLRVLGTHVTEYLVNHYGPMDDGVNRGDETDRIMVSWALADVPVPTPVGPIWSASAGEAAVEASSRTHSMIGTRVPGNRVIGAIPKCSCHAQPNKGLGGT